MKKNNRKIYYLGPKGSYTEQAAKQFFKKQSGLVEVFNIYQILDKITLEKGAYGVAPVENSSEGSLKIVLDTVIEKNLKIIGEVYLPISHSLLSIKKGLKKIKTVYSHPQAFAQCGDWLRNNIPDAKIKETESTSNAAKIVSNEKESAAIASEYCAKKYGLNILARQLEENPNNYTRFWVLGNKLINKKINDKISVFICLNDRVAALRDLLNIFAKYNINLSKIESLPLKGQAWRYGFLVDFFGNVADQKIKLAVKEIECDVAWMQILGQYKNRQDPNKTVEYFVNYLQNLFKQNKKFVERKNIKVKSADLLDRLLETRLLLIPSVALYKYLNKIPKNKIYQPKREKEIIKKRLIQIKKKNIAQSDLLIKLIKQSFSLSKDVQKTIYQMLLEKVIDSGKIKNIELNKLRDLLDQIDENFDEALASLPQDKQEKRLKELLNLK
jgi:chorismate mutase/prephenate dehydratase